MKNIRIGKKRGRGITGERNPVIEGFKNIDVTSGSANKIAGRQVKIDFSPLLFGPVTIERQTAQKFEGFWQGSKLYAELGHIKNGKPTAKWYAFREKVYAQEKGMRHPVGTKSSEVSFVDERGNKHYKYYVPKFAIYDIGKGDHQFDYMEARKCVYAPIYADFIRDTKSFKELKKMVEAGQKIQILDLDGPHDGDIPGLKSHVISVDLLKKKINDPSASFGHGYIVAGLLAGIEPEEYTQ